MGRIRSIHPGQWTDEDFVECSAFARLLCLGLRNEADDNGVFEWRPTRLKMRLFPADDLSVSNLLAELEERRIVLRYSADGRDYGAIRNFRIFQNPRSPKAEHPISPEADLFVGERAGEQTEQKRGPGRPRKTQIDETNTGEDKSIPQTVENNSVMERSGEEKEISPSDSSTEREVHQLALIHSPPALCEVGEVDTAFAAYQALRAELKPGSRAVDLNPRRRRKLCARLAEIRDQGGWNAVLAKIRGSPFLRGETSRDGKFVAEIDWILEPQNLTKVMDGNYDAGSNRGGDGQSGPAPRPDSPMSAMRTARARLGIGR